MLDGMSAWYQQRDKQCRPKHATFQQISMTELRYVCVRVGQSYINQLSIDAQDTTNMHLESRISWPRGNETPGVTRLPLPVSPLLIDLLASLIDFI